MFFVVIVVLVHDWDSFCSFNVTLLISAYWLGNWPFFSITVLGCSHCETIEITLKKHLKDDPTVTALVSEVQGDKEGIYHKSSLVNGKASWTSSSNAIWYYGGEYKLWTIGPLDNIGTTNVDIHTFFDITFHCPFDLPSEAWKYDNNGWKFAEANEINVVCIGKVYI